MSIYKEALERIAAIDLGAIKDFQLLTVLGRAVRDARDALVEPESTELTKLVETAPPRIWLQISDDPEHQNEPFPDVHEGVTWSSMAETDCAVGYVRDDLAEPEWQPIETAPKDETAALRKSLITARDAIAGQAIDAFGSGEDSNGLTWPIRDELVSNITQVLSLSAPPQEVK